MEENQTPKKEQGLFELLGPKRSFWLGMLAVFLIGSSIGFYVLLFSGADGVSSTKTTTFSGSNNTTNTTAPSVTPTAPAPTAAAVSVAPVTSDDHIRGDINTAEVIIVEFSDLECPFCKSFHPTLQKVTEEYGDKVAWVYRHFPLDSLHPKARNEAEASECAAELGGNDGFWAFIDRLYEVTPSNNGLLETQLPEIAGDVGLDVTAFNDCLASGKYADKIEAQYQDAVAAGGNGTPYSVAIGADGTIIPINGAQPYASVKSTIDGLL